MAFDGDPDVSAGVILAPGVWRPPEEITPEMLGAARQYVRDYERSCHPAPDEVVLEWLARLTAGIPHAMVGRVLEMRLEALAEAVEDAPGYVWSKANRRRAAARFTHVPASKELIDFVELVSGDERERVRRMMAIIDRGGKPVEPRPAAEPVRAWSKEIAEEYGRKLAADRREQLAELGRIIRERDAQAAEEKPASTVAEQIKRTAEHMKAMKPPEVTP